MRRIKAARGATYQPLSRQHKRILTYLILGATAFSAYYLWYGRPIDSLAIPFDTHETYMNDREIIKAGASQSYDWRDAPFINKVESYIPLPPGTSRTLPHVQADEFPESKSQRQEREARRVVVREEFEHTWQSYKQFAWAEDELRPVTGTGRKTFGGWGATLVDSLDTLWIMGLKEEFHEAVVAVAAIDFGSTNLTNVNTFETTIRYLGGMLSAYDLSHEDVLLEKAVQLGEMLYRAFDTTNNTPLNWLDIEKAKSTERQEGFTAENYLCFACFGSFTMEFTRLAQITSEPKYYDLVARVATILDRTQNSTKLPGLWPTTVNAAKEDFNQSRTFSIGALADSTYEYFPKMFALLGGLEPVYEKLYKDSAAMIDKYMLFRPMVPDSKWAKDLLLCGDVFTPQPNDVRLEPLMQHLTCFIGGMFGLAGRLFADPHHVDLGASLTRGCIHAYDRMPAGIMPENFEMIACESRSSCPWNSTAWEEGVMRHYSSPKILDFEAAIKEYNIPPGFTNLRDKRYLLRPEAIESVFIMYRITGDWQYLDDAWAMFISIVSASRTPYANGQVLDVTFRPAPPHRGLHRAAGVRGPMFTREENIEDKMESFWTAETLKYFYLIFSRPDMISLDDWVFNTEAHPFRRPKPAEKQTGD